MRGFGIQLLRPGESCEALKKNNVVQDDEVVITKKLVKNGKKNLVDYEVCVLEASAQAESNQYPVVKTNGNTNGSANGIAVSQNGQLTSSNGNGHNPQTAEFSKDYPIMLSCMTEAMLIRDELGHDVDVNKLGITLFLRKVKP